MATPRRWTAKNIHSPGNTFPGNILIDDTWHHVALIVPNAAPILANVKYYVDGAPIGNMTGTTAINTGTGPLRMGDSFGDTGRGFSMGSGSVSHLRQRGQRRR